MNSGATRKTGKEHDRDHRKQLMAVYRVLHRAYGPQHWWPGDTPFEVMVGAVLTQNTAWTNVEKAIENLKRGKLLTPSRIDGIPENQLAVLLKPSGFFNVKTKRLKNLTGLIMRRYAGRLGKMFSENPAELRSVLLAVNGIGKETADSILLYAAEKPIFVVDAYTRRVFSRHGFLSPDADYDSVQEFFMNNLRHDTLLFNEYHALIVRIGKDRCKKRKPLCSICPLSVFPHKETAAGKNRG